MPAESNAAVVELTGVCKRFGERTAVSNLDLRVLGGHCFGLLGPNGAGKTTTLKMIYGVCEPSAGQVRVFGLDIGENRRAGTTRGMSGCRLGINTRPSGPNR